MNEMLGSRISRYRQAAVCRSGPVSPDSERIVRLGMFYHQKIVKAVKCPELHLESICRCGAIWGEGHIFMVLLKGLE
jgi:hypothetical protein